MADGDVALLSGIAAQVGGVFHISIGSSGFANQGGSEVRSRVTCGRKVDGKMFGIISAVSCITTQPHSQGTLQVELRRNQIVVRSRCDRAIRTINVTDVIGTIMSRMGRSMTCAPGETVVVGINGCPARGQGLAFKVFVEIDFPVAYVVAVLPSYYHIQFHYHY